ncbi:MAG: DDE-type integrase/transposase/recombinase [Candidatus Bipolaricaulia bacterium]
MMPVHIRACLSHYGVVRAHTTMWYWLQTAASKLTPWHGSLPETIVVDETRVQVGSRACWIYTAIDPYSQRIIYVKPYWYRSGGNTRQFFQELAQIYGQWPKEVITDGGLWYAVELAELGQIKQWRVVRGKERDTIEGWFGEFLKRRAKDFDRYFPNPSPSRSWELRRVKNWLWVYCWWYNWRLQGDLLMLN